MDYQVSQKVQQLFDKVTGMEPVQKALDFIRAEEDDCIDEQITSGSTAQARAVPAPRSITTEASSTAAASPTAVPDVSATGSLRSGTLYSHSSTDRKTARICLWLRRTSIRAEDLRDLHA